MTHLTASGLRVEFPPRDPHANAAVPVRACDFDIAPGRIVGLVGESGCGKSMSALACLGLLPGAARSSGSIRLGTQELVGLDEPSWARVRGRRIAMIFQNPMAAMNPFFTVGHQLEMVIRTHFPLSRGQAREKAAQALARVDLPATSASRYPHQMSGGQLQRVMIAMAIACEPDFLIADEPTTALDVTVQARIMQLLKNLTAEGMGMLLISHDLELVAQVSDHIHVMYAGRVVEHGPAMRMFRSPSHPYAEALLRAQPHLGRPVHRLPVIGGQVPASDQVMAGCVFADRCERALPACATTPPPVRTLHRQSAVFCHDPILAAGEVKPLKTEAGHD